MTEQEGIKLLTKEQERLGREVVRRSKYASMVNNIVVFLWSIVQIAVPTAVLGLVIWGIIAIMSGIFIIFGWR